MAQTPILTLTYTFTTADALAYEAMPREMVGWRKWAFLLWLAGIGGVVAFLPVEWVGPEGGLVFWVAALVLVGLGWLLATGAITLRTHSQARRRIPAPVAVTVEQWGDHLAIDTGGRRTVIAWETIAAVNVAKDHVFIDAPPAVLIVPLRAFEDGAAMSAFADNIDQLSHDSAL
jgi:hypothetical protein